MKEKGELLEWAQVFDRFYGTPKGFVLDQLKQNRLVLLAIDVQGARSIRQFKDKFPLMTLFILPPSVEVLKKRLEGRKTETPEQIEQRLRVAQEEMKEAGDYDQTVTNQNLENTIEEIEKLIQQYQNGKE